MALVNWPPVVRAIVTILPPMAALAIVYAPYDGFFDDRNVFLYFLGGLVLGTLVGFLEVVLVFSPVAIRGLLLVLLAPVAANLGKTVAVNLPRFQGDTTSVFHGGSIGAGTGAMVALAYGQAVLQPGDLLTSGLLLLALGGGAALTHVAGGLVVGKHVAYATPFRGVIVASLLTAPAPLFAFEHLQGGHPLWAGLSALYGVGILTWAARVIIPQSFTIEERKAMRRAKRRERS